MWLSRPARADGLRTRIMVRTEHPASRSARRLLLPYASCMVVVVGLLPLEERVDWIEVSAALTLLLAAGAGLAAAALGHERRDVTLASLLGMLGAIMLLRDGVGASAGFGPLIFLPVLWAALQRRRTDSRSCSPASRSSTSRRSSSPPGRSTRRPAGAGAR